MLIDDIKKMQEEIKSLPQGYISTKIIDGRECHYLQHTAADGNIVGRPIPDSEYEQVCAGIARRRELERKLSEINSIVYYNIPSPGMYPDWPLDVVVGEKLKRMVSVVSGWEKRDCYGFLTDFLYSARDFKVCALYGLRRTGKTVLIYQVINDMTDEDFAHAAYAKLRKGQDIAMVRRCLDTLDSMGYRYIFLDEITLLEEFTDTASVLSDIFAPMGMKIVLSGTDSLSFWFASRHELYDRVYLIHTTWIPFREHSRLLGTDDIDEYIEQGGTLYGNSLSDKPEDTESGICPFTDAVRTDKYVQTSIAENIQHALKCFENGNYFRRLGELYYAGELTDAINRVVEDMNHKFVISVFNSEFKSSDLNSARQMLHKSKTDGEYRDILDRIDREAVTARLMESLKIKELENRKVPITDIHVAELKDYLFPLEVIASLPEKHYEPYRDNRDTGERILVVQPGLRYCQANALIDSLRKDDFFTGCSKEDRDYICNLIRNDVKGRMLEELVQYDTMKSLGKGYEVFKLKFADAEFDMVVYSKATETCSLYEIKHSTEHVPNQAKFLLNDELCAGVVESVGDIAGKYVLYRGEDFTDGNGIRYLNVSRFLKNLPGSAIIT